MADKNRNGNGWRTTREKILMFSGLGIIGVEAVNAEILGRGAFHYEFLFVGLALCGVSIAQWGDHK